MIVESVRLKPILAQRLQQAFIETFARTEMIFSWIAPEAYWERPIGLRHPVNFYEGHLAAFIWNTLFRRILGVPAFNADFDRLFERGIDPGSEDAAQAQTIQRWPERALVRAYQREIHQRLFDFLEQADFEAPAHPLLKNGEALFLLLEHEWMHQETLLYMFHQLPHELKRKPADYQPVADGKSPEPRMVEIPAGVAVLGAVPGHFDYAWDNELPQKFVETEAFAMDAFNVTNGEFLAFVEAGSYQNQALWTPEAWQWLQEREKNHPLFWRKSSQGWLLRDFFEDRPLPLAWPVYVTQAEASAYARFVGKSLPTEVEWHRAIGEKDSLMAGAGNFDFRHFSPVPVGSFPQSVSPEGVHDLTGNGWEWTATPFAPFEGFQASQGYPQYSADFFDGRHFVVKGASCFTDARLLRPSFRNWFYWHYPYMYAGFRCVSR